MVLMDSDKKTQIKAHARAIAALLYEETDPQLVQTLEGIEETVRDHILEHVSPEIGSFLLKQLPAQPVGGNEISTASLDN
jgi:hypothetical protein